MKRRLLWCVALLGLASGMVYLVRANPQKEELDPVKLMPHTHSVLFENKFVRVLQAKVPAGATEVKHGHPQGVTVYLADYTVEIKTLPDGKAGRHQRKFGTVSWSDAVVHEVKNVGRTASHAIRVELKY